MFAILEAVSDALPPSSVLLQLLPGMEDGVYLYYQPQVMDMSSYLAVTGTPVKEASQVFGCTPREVRYLRVRHIFDHVHTSMI